MMETALLQMLTENPLPAAIVATFATFLSVSAAVVLVSGYANKALGAQGVAARAVSFVVAFGLVAVGYFAGIGYLAESTLLSAASDALVIWLSANGIFTADFVKGLLGSVGASQPSVESYVSSKR